MTELAKNLRNLYEGHDYIRCHAAQRPVLCQASWPWRTEGEGSSAVESSRIRDTSSAEKSRGEGSESGTAGFVTNASRGTRHIENASKFKRVRMDFTMEALLGRETSNALEKEEDEIPRWLPSTPHKGSARALHNAAALAYLGDSVYELFARRHFLNPPHNLDLYSSRVTAIVCCEAQDWLLRRLMKQEFLTEEERDVLRWGRNAPTGSRKAKGRAGGAVYSSATSLETLVGFLYLTNQERLEEMMCQLGFGLGGKAILPVVSDRAG